MKTTTDVKANDRRTREILERRAAALAVISEHQVSRGEVEDLMVFQIDEARYGVRIEQIKEVQPLDGKTWCRIPCTPDFVLGAVNIRGIVYSILNIAKYLGVGSTEIPESAHVLLASAGKTADGDVMEVCILADDLPQSRTVNLEDINPPGGAVSARAQQFVRGVTPDMVMVLDLGQLLSEQGIIVNEEP
jgi:purine-binding chemotaxis protein CheW